MSAQLETIEQPKYIPGLPSKLDDQPLRIVEKESINSGTDLTNITPAIGIATILFHWCPDALWAFLDTKSWLSMTWNLATPDDKKFEIGRIRNQVTFGKLDKEGLWEVMITYDIIEQGGLWVANTEESMLGEENVEDEGEVDRLAGSFVWELLLLNAGPKTKYYFFVEAMEAPMDPFSDGLAVDPRWLYQGLDLSKCTACGNHSSEKASLARCGRCGTAAYCSSACQKEDWPVHRAVCTLSTIDRGKALHLSSNGGLVKYDWSKGIDTEKEENATDE